MRRGPRSGPIRPKVLRVAIPIAETGFDPQAAQDLYSATIMSVIFDPLYEYGLPCAPESDRSADGRSAARDIGGWPDVEDQDSQRHLLRRRSGVQGRQARAHRPRLRVFAEASRGPEDALAQRLHSARQARGPFRGGGESRRQARLQRRDRRAARARPLHAAAYICRYRLYVPASVDGDADGRRRPRSHRRVRRREWLGHGQPGGDRRIPVERVAPWSEDRARREPETIARNSFPGCRQRPTPTRARHSPR